MAKFWGFTRAKNGKQASTRFISRPREKAYIALRQSKFARSNEPVAFNRATFDLNTYSKTGIIFFLLLFCQYYTCVFSPDLDIPVALIDKNTAI